MAQPLMDLIALMANGETGYFYREEDTTQSQILSVHAEDGFQQNLDTEEMVPVRWYLMPSASSFGDLRTGNWLRINM